MPSRREGLRERRRERVLRAALDVIAERGLSETRMTDIAERAGMSAGHILYYFESKNDLLLQALRWSEDQLLRQAREEFVRLPKASERFVRFVELAAPVGPADPGWVLWLEVWSLAPHDRKMARGQAAIDRRYIRTLADVVRYGQVTGEFPAELDADEFALRFSALMDGLAIKVVGGAVDMTAEGLLEIALAAAAEELGVDVVGGAGAPAAGLP